MAEKPLENWIPPGLATFVRGFAPKMNSRRYGEPRRLAGAKMRFERKKYTPQPTAHVNETCFRFTDRNEHLGEDRVRVSGLAAHVMPDILELHFFARLAFGETTVQFGLSAGTVNHDWSMARAWLRQGLSSIS
jgi:hypothetical protein